MHSWYECFLASPVIRLVFHSHGKQFDIAQTSDKSDSHVGLQILDLKQPVLIFSSGS